MMIDYHFCGESDHDKNAFVSVHWGLLPIDGTIRSLQRLTTFIAQAHFQLVRTARPADIRKGHNILDQFVLKVRREHIKTMPTLPGPKR